MSVRVSHVVWYVVGAFGTTTNKLPCVPMHSIAAGVTNQLAVARSTPCLRNVACTNPLDCCKCKYMDRIGVPVVVPVVVLGFGYSLTMAHNPLTDSKCSQSELVVIKNQSSPSAFFTNH